MPDNVLKATVDAIAESDNEIGGSLITRLREAHLHGRDDGEIDTAVAVDRLISPVSIFVAGMVGQEIDIIAKSPLTGNQGRYLVGALISPTQAQLTDLLGAPVVLVDEDPVVWRFATLRVETTLDFLVPPSNTEAVGKLWVGTEDKPVTYTALTLVPGASTFAQLGNPLTGEGYLTALQREDAVVVDARRGYSAIDHLRRAFQVAYAEAEELDRIGRRYGETRPGSVSDAIYRALLQILPFLPRTLIWAFEMVLQALYPAKTPTQIRAMIYEDSNYPCTIFLALPDDEPSSDYEGKHLFEVVEDLDSTDATHVTVSDDPLTPVSVLVRAVEQTLAMAVLPTADAPAWAYVAESAGAEGAYFSIVAMAGNDVLHQTHPAGTDGGRYERAINSLDGADGDWVIEGWWARWLPVTIGGLPWHLIIRDGQYEYALSWDLTTMTLETLATPPVVKATTAIDVSTGWHHFRLERHGSRVIGSLDGHPMLEAVDSQFDVSALKRVSFGYLDHGVANEWSCRWDRMHAWVRRTRNHWNLRGDDGTLAAASNVLTSAAALFVAADTDRLVRLSGVLNRNRGVYRATFTAANQLTLSSVIFGAVEDPPVANRYDWTATVSGIGTAALIRLSIPYFTSDFEGARITTEGSAVPANNGDFDVLEYIDPYTIRVNHPTAFVTEAGLRWGQTVRFDNEAGLRWEIVAAGTVVGDILTLRDTLPEAVTPVETTYSVIPSAQLTRDEMIRNDGAGGVEPHVYYPSYFLDVSLAIRALLDEIKAAGVILEYHRTY